MIFHVVSKESWQNACEQGFYEAPSLATEGFIHCSRKEQVQGVLERYFQNHNDLVLLHIDENKLTAMFTYEMAPSVNETFPHIYGPLNLDAVVETEDIII